MRPEIYKEADGWWWKDEFGFSNGPYETEHDAYDEWEYYVIEYFGDEET